jgi:Zn-dependent membrane protease YugP
MHQPGARQQAHEENCDPFMRVISGLGTALFICGIFIPGAHNLMMVGIALMAIAYVV